MAEKSLLKKQVLTTKDAAELIGVSLPSIINWADAGQFESFRTPGGHRRIKTDTFLAFARLKGYLIVDNVKKTSNKNTSRVIVLVDTNQDYISTLQDFLSVQTDTEVFLCQDVFWAGVLVAQKKNAIVVVDAESVQLPNDFLQKISQYVEHVEVDVVVLSSVFPVPAHKQQPDVIYLNKSNNIKAISLAIVDLLSV